MPYSFKLPHKFLIWWLFKGPIRALKISGIIVVIANNELSFLTNIRLLFVPLFGIRTIPGRLISFFARIFMILLGLFFLTGMAIGFMLVPIMWFLIPILLYRIHSWLVPTYLIALYILWEISNLNIPDKKVIQVDNLNNYINSFRPLAKYHLKSFLSNQKESLNKLILNKNIVYLLKKSELDKKEIKDKLLKATNANTSNILKNAFELAKENKSRYVEIEHLFISIMQNIPSLDTVLSSFNSNIEIIKQSAFWIVEEREALSKIYIWQRDYNLPTFGGTGKGMLGRVTPKLDQISEDITEKVKRGRLGRIVGREEEIKKISEILDSGKNDILLIGESGSGKTSIIRGIAYKIIYGTDYQTLKNKRVVSLDVGSLVAGDGSSGTIAEKLKGALEEVEGSGDIILFIDEIQNLVTSMGEVGGEDSTVLSMLQNYVSDESTRVIGATSISNYRKYIETNEAVARLFQIIKIDEISSENTLKVLKYTSSKKEKEYKILITYPAIQKSIELSEKLIHERVLPDKAIDILDRTSAQVKNTTKYLTSNDIEKEISEMTDVPLTTINIDEAKKLLNIGEDMKKRVIGQNQAIDKISTALQRARTGMRNEKKPIASFLFVGTTGVGKTETAKTLAFNYFGDEQNMIRMDMSEYQQLDSINRILGSPDGSITGVLTSKVRSKPFSLILLDEIEKAHTNILQTFLQILDEGVLTDTLGNEVDFTNTIIIATSNVGTKSIQAIFDTGGSYEKMQEMAMEDVRNKFAPELLNRFTGIVVFNPLSIDNLREITKLMLKRVEETAKQKGISISYKPELIDELIKRGYSPQWGARPLARAIEDSVESYLAIKILKNDIKAGDSITLGMDVFSI